MTPSALVFGGERAISTTELGRRLGWNIPSTVIKRFVQPMAETSTGVYWREKDLALIAMSLACSLIAVADEAARQEISNV